MIKCIYKILIIVGLTKKWIRVPWHVVHFWYIAFFHSRSHLSVIHLFLIIKLLLLFLIIWVTLLFSSLWWLFLLIEWLYTLMVFHIILLFQILSLPWMLFVSNYIHFILLWTWWKKVILFNNMWFIHNIFIHLINLMLTYLYHWVSYSILITLRTVTSFIIDSIDICRH